MNKITPKTKHAIIAVIDTGYGSYNYERNLFEANGFKLKIFQSKKQDRESRLAFAKEAVGILVRGTQMDAHVLSQLPHLKAIVRYGVGFDNVDLQAAQRSGIRVANVQGYANESVSDHALALLFSCARLLRLGQKEVQLKCGVPPSRDVMELVNKTLGIVGLGRIGGTLCRKSQSLFSRVLAVDPYIPAKRFNQLGAISCDLDTLLYESDAISLHCNLTDETRGLIDKHAFKKMKRHPILINTARGAIIESEPLLDALQRNIIHSAGIDVYPEEPPGENLTSLLIHPRVVATGHYAWYSPQSIETLQKRAAHNMLSLLRGDPVADELTAGGETQ